MKGRVKGFLFAVTNAKNGKKKDDLLLMSMRKLAN